MENQGNILINTEKMKVDEHSLVLIRNRLHHSILHPKLHENTPLHSFNVTHAGTKNHQVTRSFMDNQENILINTEKMKLMNMHWCSFKTDCTIKFSIPKLFENTPFHNSMVEEIIIK